MQEQFQQQAQKDPAGFRLALREAFGDKAGLSQIDLLLDLALVGKLPMPANIKFVEATKVNSRRVPHIEDLKNLDGGTLEDLRDDLQNSLEQRKQVSKDRGPDAAHSRREAAEEDLLKSINKHLGNN